MRSHVPWMLVFAGMWGCAPQKPDVVHVSTVPTSEPERVAPGEPIVDAAPVDAGSSEDVRPDLPPAWTAEHVAQAMDAGKPLPEELSQVLGSVEFDPFPEQLVLDAHYWVSNENFHHLYKPWIDDHGGILLGVGTDQNYLMAGWSRSPILLMMDFDEQIRNVHEIYGVIFRRTATPSEHVRAWSKEEQVVSWLGEDFEGVRLEELKTTYSRSRRSVLVRLRKVITDYKEREIPTYLSDQAQYDFVRSLWTNGRVFSLRGDLTADKTMVQIARALADHQLVLGIVYLSNAEQYFDFTPEFRRNIIAQPFDERSVVLRTRPWDELGFPEGGSYHYNVQAAGNFREWLETHRVKNASRLLAGWRSNDDEIPGLSEVKRKPRPTSNPPEIAPHAP